MKARRTREEDLQEILEARDLLMLWYRRWQGSLPKVPPELALDTKAFIERHGEQVPIPVFAR